MALNVQPSMEIVGSDGVFVGTVDRVEGLRLKLSRSAGFGSHKKHHHYIDLSLVTRVEGRKVHLPLSAEAAIALLEDERQDGTA